MSEKEKIRADSFRKLDDFVKGELQYLVDNKFSLKSFKIENMLSDYLSPEEQEVVANCIQQLQKGKVVCYCSCRDIDIPKQLIKEL